jgi:hypothetical protein
MRLKGEPMSDEGTAPRKKVYVATSWRNEFQPGVVAELKEDGHEVYDFQHPEPGNDGFSWRAVDPHWQTWTPDAYLAGLKSAEAEHGFNLDMNALRAADVCVYVMPCGVSASLEAGWAAGAGKRVAIYVPRLREPDLMVKMADIVTTDLVELCNWVRDVKPRETAHAQEIAQLRAEIELTVAELKGWKDFFSGQPKDLPYRGSTGEAKESSLNFHWTVGYQAALESDVFRLMVGRADKAQDQVAQLTARLREIENAVHRLWLEVFEKYSGGATGGLPSPPSRQ